MDTENENSYLSFYIKTPNRPCICNNRECNCDKELLRKNTYYYYGVVRKNNSVSDSSLKCNIKNHYNNYNNNQKYYNNYKLIFDKIKDYNGKYSVKLNYDNNFIGDYEDQIFEEEQELFDNNEIKKKSNSLSVYNKAARESCISFYCDTIDKAKLELKEYVENELDKENKIIVNDFKMKYNANERLFCKCCNTHFIAKNKSRHFKSKTHLKKSNINN